MQGKAMRSLGSYRRRTGSRSCRGASFPRMRVAIGLVVLLLGGVPGVADAATVFPLKASADGRYLVDQNSKPFRIQGDSPWDILVSASSSDVDAYLANRTAKGFNTLLMELVEHKHYVDWTSPSPANKNGDLPFTRNLAGGAYTGAGDLADLSAPNDSYFQFVDTVLAEMAANDMVALLTPLYTGYGTPTAQASINDGWSADMNANSSSNCYKYGQYVGYRYRDQKNVIWVAGGDWFLPQSTPNIATCMHQVMQGIRDGNGILGSTVPQTAHWSRGHLSSDDPSFSFQVNSVYVLPTDIVSLCRTALDHSPKLPAYAIEEWYEGEHSMTRDGLRKEGYVTVLSCIGGYVFGNFPLWGFAPGWQSAMDADGSVDWQRAGTFFDAIDWENLVPSNNGTLLGTALIAGGDDVTAGGDVVAAASTKTLVAYLPSTGTSARTISVNMSVLSGPGRARWYNPTSGAYIEISGGAYSIPNSGTRAFTTLGDNGTGTNDWVLVLDVTSGRPPPPTNLHVVEYYYSGFDHYFMTANPAEIAALDGGAFGGAWVRTGQTFLAYPDPTAGAAPVCRFFSTAFGAKSSHFYTANAFECGAVKQNPGWQYEGIAFDISVPDAAGNCPAGTVPVYRLYNNGQGGAPNHRFTTDLSIQQDFVDNRGYVAEGAGIGITMCSP